jgi:glycosyltransferase involved in cell wall biosynthesis
MAEPSVVAFDAGPARARATGVGVYVRDLGRALTARAPGRVVMIGARPDGPLASEAATTMATNRHLLWLQRDAVTDARRAGATAAHFTNATAPLRPRMPYVLTIQDLSLLRYPHYHPVLRLAAIPFVAIAALHARRVLVPSHATADEVHSLLRIPAQRIEVIELAPPDESVSVASAAPDEVIGRWGLESSRYVLSIATLEPRKNIARLVAAFEAMADDHPGLQLVLVGGRGWRTARIERTISRSRFRNRIVVTGYVSDEVRAALLAGCAAFAYVSLYEGFGLPVIEAMAAGAPVVTSDISSLPQAAGGAAVLVDPNDARAIALGIAEAMERTTELREAGRARVGKLSWDRVAAETLAVYDDASL